MLQLRAQAATQVQLAVQHKAGVPLIHNPAQPIASTMAEGPGKQLQLAVYVAYMVDHSDMILAGMIVAMIFCLHSRAGQPFLP